jgi:hypothetical protein
VRLSTIISLVRRKVNDPNAKYWSDLDITQELDLFQRNLFRDLVDAHESYGLRNFDILTTDTARIEQLYGDIWLYHYPEWGYKIREVRRLNQEDGALTQAEGRKLDYIESGRREVGWTFADSHALRLQGFSASIPIRIVAAKIPTLLEKGTVAKDAVATNTIILPEANSLGYENELEDGSYLGARIEVRTATATRDPRRRIATVVNQVRSYDSTLAAYIFTLTVRPNFSDLVLAADSFELHSEIPDPCIEYLVLLTAEALFHKTQNLVGAAGLQRSLEREREKFENSLQPRTDGITHQVSFPEDVIGRRDPDRDLYMPY